MAWHCLRCINCYGESAVLPGRNGNTARAKWPGTAFDVLTATAKRRGSQCETATVPGRNGDDARAKWPGTAFDVLTATAKRPCCQGEMATLPGRNGLALPSMY